MTFPRSIARLLSTYPLGCAGTGTRLLEERGTDKGKPAERQGRKAAGSSLPPRRARHEGPKTAGLPKGVTNVTV